MRNLEIMIRKPLLLLLTLLIVLQVNSQNSTSEEDSLFLGVPMISLDKLEENNDEGFTYSLASASWNSFESATTFSFRHIRSNFRGYDGGYTTFLLNGVPLNDMVLGWFSFGNLGGLTNVLYGRNNSYGLEANNLNIGQIGGVQSIDLRAAGQRKRFQGTYSFANGAYSHRLMLTYNTGVLEKGWAVSMSLNKRWAQEGYYDGTFYDTYGYFFGVEKIIRDDHRLALSVIGNAGRRGRGSGHIQELYDLAGTNKYNGNWGWQNGEKRNSRVVNQHQPIVSLNYEWNKDNKLILRHSAFFQTGRYGVTAIDRFNAKDPRPTYYRNLPSYQDDPILAQQVKDEILANPNLLQISWDDIYNTNYNSTETLENADGIEGNTVTGRQAKYVLPERRADVLKFGDAITFEWAAAERLKIDGGLNFRHQTTHYYNKLQDLLGADYHVDINTFAERDFPNDPDRLQSDLNNPNRIVYEGDTYGNDYKAKVQDLGLWLQGTYKLEKLDFLLAASVAHNSFYRTGNFKSGLFPENSFGDSEKSSFIPFQVKGGLTYKITSRHYLFGNATYQTNAPTFREAFVSPRTRNSIVPDLKTQKIASFEGGYLLQHPEYKARAVFYYTAFNDATRSLSFWHDDFQSFVNYSLTNVDTRHFGTELMVEAQIVTGLTGSVVAVLGRHIHNGRPNATITRDNDEEALQTGQVIYADKYYVAGTPNAATFGLNYQGKKHWRLGMEVVYSNGSWIPINPARRTTDATELVDYQSDQWNAILEQEKTDAYTTLNINGGYSWSLNQTFKGMKSRRYMVFNVGLSNVLNKRDIITGGYEQLRFDDDKDPNKFPTRYYYGQGIYTYINISFRM